MTEEPEEQEFDEEKWDKEQEYILNFRKQLLSLSKQIKEPMDTRIEPLFAVAYSLLSEQLAMGKRFEWRKRPSQDDEFMDDQDKNIPSVDELRRMMGDE